MYAAMMPPEMCAMPDVITVMSSDWVILGSGSRSSKIRVSPEALRRLPAAQVVPVLASAG